MIDVKATTGGSAIRVRGGMLMLHRPVVMGVLNATPDSFSDVDDGTRGDVQLRRLDELLTAGAQIVDIGGQSAITGVPEISEDEEISRIEPVVRAAAEAGAIVSIDTYRAGVADAALQCGAHIINDISFMMDEEMPDVVARHQAGYVLMHNPGRPKVRLTETALYDDVVAAVIDGWRSKLAELHARHVQLDQVLLDFGPDFGKTPQQTLACVRAVPEFAAIGRPLMIALSRKDFIGTALDLAPRDRDEASLAAMLWCAAKYRQCIIRTHRPAALRLALRMVDLLEGTAELAPDARLDPSLWRQRTEST